jgi:hypothetical protein
VRHRATALLAAAAALTALLARQAPRKQLIEWGWDEPDTAFLRAHIREMEKTPFDGCVYHVVAMTATGPANLTWQAWGRRAFQDDDLRQAEEDLRATRFGRFRSNFLRFNVTPADIDWYDDHQAVFANARRAARLARLGGGAGIALDTEQYQGQLFDPSRQRDGARRSFADYSAQARRRGRELMQAFEEGYPGLTLLLTFGQSFVQGLRVEHRVELERISYGLLAPFLDGLVEGAARARIVDGHEPSYAYTSRQQFRAAYALMRDTGPALAAEPSRYARVTSFGFGIWMDYASGRLGWDAADASRNYFTPEKLHAATREALLAADEYVWIYSEQPRWWSDEAGTVKLPVAYADALSRAKREAAGRARRPRRARPPAAARRSRGGR